MAETKVKAAKRNFDQDNPFLKHGNYSNYILFHEDKPAAHISAIMDSRHPADIGCIGCFESINNSEFARHLFEEAKKFLVRHGKKVICGPVDLTTWQSFRVSYPEGRPPFFIEPFTRGYYRDLFRAYGFKVAQQNLSTIGEVEKTGFNMFGEDLKRLERENMIFESMTQESFPRIMHDIYELTKEIFRDTWSFVPIGLDEFEYNIRDIAAMLDRDFVYLVRNQEKLPVAFCFCIPDMYSKDVKRVVLKTIGVLPKYRGMGIGKALMYLLYRTASEKKVSHCIVSTMRSDNKRMRDLTRSCTIYREYEAYELTL
ncbi:MAG: GNAT family N-acetyltransferase [Nitrospirota bacterium]|nr:GNAT family N-acetyltransferase [Nitrospirota bacterium]